MNAKDERSRLENMIKETENHLEANVPSSGEIPELNQAPTFEIDYDDLRETIRIHRDAPPIIFANIGTTMKEGIDDIREAYGLSLIKRLESIGVYRFRIPSGSTVEDMVDALNGDPQVEYAEPNYTVGIIGK